MVVLYFKRFFQSFDFYFKLLVAFIPAVVFGLLFSKKIDALLESPLTVAVSLLIGGIILLKVDDWFTNAEEVQTSNEISYAPSFQNRFISMFGDGPGSFQKRQLPSLVECQQKLSRKTAAEFSFFLAVPTMLGATAKKCYDYYKDGLVLSHDQINFLIIGNVVAFIVALIAIKSFIGFLTKHGFKVFGYYRIIAGIITFGNSLFHSSFNRNLMLSTEDFLNGQIILIDKPLHWTSFQAVNKLKYALINKAWTS